MIKLNFKKNIKLYSIISGLILISCNNKTIKNAEKINSNINLLSTNDTINLAVNDTINKASVISLPLDLINECKELSVWIGSIQGSNMRDTFLMGECNDSSTYDLILIPKNEKGKNVSFFNKNRGNWKKYYDAYFFLVKKNRIENPKNEFDLYEYAFPSNIEVIIFKDNKWEKRTKVRINSRRELGEMKYKIIKNIK